jgi:hypothetical protein
MWPVRSIGFDRHRFCLFDEKDGIHRPRCPTNDLILLEPVQHSLGSPAARADSGYWLHPMPDSVIFDFLPIKAACGGAMADGSVRWA